jgi:hypothetical protein
MCSWSRDSNPAGVKTKNGPAFAGPFPQGGALLGGELRAAQNVRVVSVSTVVRVAGAGVVPYTGSGAVDCRGLEL